MTGTAPPPAFFDELGAAFRRLRPQGSPRWCFADAFDRLERVVTGWRRPPPSGVATARTSSPPPGPPNAEADPDPVPARSVGSPRALAREWAERRVAPWVAHRADRAARSAAAAVLGEGLEEVEEGFEATAEAFRYLAFRVDVLEEEAARRRRPIEGIDALVPPPDLATWQGPVVAWMDGVVGDVVVGDCGDGALPVALAAAGHTVRGAEPRAATAWEASQRGVDVHVGPVLDLVTSYRPGSLAALVLAGVVEREEAGDLVQLLAVATDRLAPGAPLVVVSTSPAEWDAVALDLLPGRPLHAATWELLLRRSGFEKVETVGGTGAYAVKGQR